MSGRYKTFPWPRIGFICLILPLSVQAVSELQTGRPAPAFDLPVIGSPPQHVAFSRLKGKPAILMFGELYNENTIHAVGDMDQLRRKLEISKTDFHLYLILAQKAEPAELVQIQHEKKLNAILLHDLHREAYAAYHVVVLPSTVILDAQGNVVLAISGYPLTFSDIMEEAILYAYGKTTRKAFQTALGSDSVIPAVSENTVRASRMVSLGRQLFRRNYTDLAVERYYQALELDPNYLPAHIGIARCQIRMNHLDAATAQLEQVKQVDPYHTEADVVMAYIEILRGGSDLGAAQRRLELALLRSPNNPEALYLRGMAYEMQDQTDKALTQYKQAAQILLETHGSYPPK